MQIISKEDFFERFEEFQNSIGVESPEDFQINRSSLLRMAGFVDERGLPDEALVPEMIELEAVKKNILEFGRQGVFPNEAKIFLWPLLGIDIEKDFPDAVRHLLERLVEKPRF